MQIKLLEPWNRYHVLVIHGKLDDEYFFFLWVYVSFTQKNSYTVSMIVSLFCTDELYGDFGNTYPTINVLSISLSSVIFI